MIELPLLFFGGLLGSTHCLGMCGPLALSLGVTSGGVRSNLQRQLVFSAGRIFTYGFLGALAGYCGWWLSTRPTLLVNAQSVMAIAAGAFLMVLGLASAGMLPRQSSLSLIPHACGAGGWLRTYLTSPTWSGALLAGVFTGFLPCGLVYAFLALAATSASVVEGWIIMAIFGLGTVPLMVLAGCGSDLLSPPLRTRVLRVAAWCVVLAGFITMARGFGFLQLSADAAPLGIPFCR